MSISSPFTTRRLSATALTLCAVLAVPVGAQENAEPRTEQIVSARIGLKEQVALFMTQIEGPASEGATLDQRVAYAKAIGAILDAFPHLFPAASSSQALAEAGHTVSTSAAPAIWDDIDTFHARAAATADEA